MWKVIWMSLLLGTVAAGCGGTDDGGSADTDVDTDTDTDTDGDADSDTGRDTSAYADSEFGELGDTFRYGINGGHRNAGWGDDLQAELEITAGINSQRLSLPERHLDQWGYDIEIGDMNAYADLGMSHQVAFLTSPIREHSTAPSSAADWELTHYPPANLYEPITVDGEINPENYWAYYVYQTVSTYKEWVKVWEIWNEPDYTSNWNDTLTWRDAPPMADQLPRWGGSIFEYIRLLRISRAAARMADPEALIATGGIGYATFLHAILNHTDNPEDGSVTDAYPRTGHAYFDVLSFHHYPIYTPGNSDDAVAGYLAHLEELKGELAAANKMVAGVETTESGAPRYVVDDYPGSDAYARAYLMKVMIKAQAAGVHGIDWFTLSDGALAGEGDSSYDYMGLFEDTVDLDTIDEAIITDAGIAYATLGGVLGHANHDPDTTAELLLPDGVTGEAFITAEGSAALALWAVTDDGTEIASAEVSFDTGGSYTVYRWDHSATDDTATWTADGIAPLSLTNDVTLLVAQ